MPHVELTFAGDSISHSRLQWSQAGRLGKRRTSSSVGRLHPRGKATTIARPRSTVLDCAEENLERLENGAGDRSARNRDLMAAQAIQTVLVEPVAAERTRPPASKFGDP